MRAERDVARQAGAEVKVGLHDVRPGRGRIHHQTGDAGDSHCNLQDGKEGSIRSFKHR